MTNNSLSNINNNKWSLSKLENQYSSGKKITRPSEDPIVAVRALRLRKNLDELNQFYEKNIPDAMSWMDSTEGALNNMNSLLTNIYAQFNQGANDTLTASDRASIVENLKGYKNQIYQEGNANYAGRYLFSGYKTNTSLVFDEASTDTMYTINETFKGSDITSHKVVTGDDDYVEYDPANPDASLFENKAKTTEVYRIRLSYDAVHVAAGTDKITYTIDGVDYEADVVSSSDKTNAYQLTGNAQFIPETGELVFSSEQYNKFQGAKEISITYDKNSFKENELRPEHYFDCRAVKTAMVDGKEEVLSDITYTQEDQQIQYEVNFGQKLTINTQGKDALTHTLGREIDEIVALVSKIEGLESEIGEVEKKLAEQGITEKQKEALTALKESLTTELTLQSKIMQETFSKGMKATSAVQDQVNEAVADHGARYVRLELVEERLGNQQVEYEDLLSKNEDADLVEVVVKYNAQETIYNASLSVASKIAKNTLLDFI